MILNKKYKFEDINFDKYIEEDSIDTVKSIKEKKEKRSEINLVKAKWSPHTDSLAMLNNIRFKMKELGIKVGSDTKKISELKQFLATMHQIYMVINGMLGKIDQKAISDKIKSYKKELREMEENGVVDENIHDKLLELQEDIELELDHINLNLEKTGMYAGGKKAEDMIVQ